MKTPQNTAYEPFLSSLAGKQWQRIGLNRRAGVCAPLFSLHSQRSIGIGEIPDLKLLVDWCRKTRMSIIQLLPMNDVGFRFTPYDAQSTFALDPMYLSLEELEGVPLANFESYLQKIRKAFPSGEARVNYGIKKEKLEVLWKMFQTTQPQRLKKFIDFTECNKHWLVDYAMFKVIKEGFQEACWENWPEDLRSRNSQALEHIARDQRARILFHEWLQWQLFVQFQDVRDYARDQRVYLMGDLPFLVSRDSADVWAHQNYFKLNLSSGAPPDFFFAKGQRWGMPPYDWLVIESHHYDYLIQKVKYSENFYDMFRIDHVVGTFRLWTISLAEPLENHGLNGRFDPPHEHDWEQHGRKILSVMIKNAEMLPCAEDLGVVPECSNRTLWDFGIPGMEVQRWTKNWHSDAGFKDSGQYRLNSIAVISNHDTTSFRGWWEFEADTVDEGLFQRKCAEKNLDFNFLKEKIFDLEKSFHGRLRWKEFFQHPDLLIEALGQPRDRVWDIVEMYQGSYGEKRKFWYYVGLEGECEPAVSPKFLEAAFRSASQSSSIFSIQLLQDLLDLGPVFKHDAWDYRINFPGTTGEHNWSLVIPVSLESLNRAKVNSVIRKINEAGDRI